MTNVSEELIRISGYGRKGFADTYDGNRPAPPAALLDVLTMLARTERPAVVVDLGCGTGLSTRVWADRAQEVIGVEPNPAMRIAAEARTQEWTVRYVEAFASETGLPDGGADIVTCSQSFHWMEPATTLAEAARILRPGGVFAAYDYDMPPVIDPEIDAAFVHYLAARVRQRERQGAPAGGARWMKDGHLGRIEASGLFASTREVVLHGLTSGGAARVAGLAGSIGPPLEETLAELDELCSVADRVLGDRVVPWHLGYRVRIGIR